MTFGAQFKVNQVIDLQDAVPGRQQAQATCVPESVTGSLFGGGLAFNFGSGQDLQPGDVVHVNGWIEKSRAESAAPPPEPPVPSLSTFNEPPVPVESAGDTDTSTTAEA